MLLPTVFFVSATLVIKINLLKNNVQTTLFYTVKALYLNVTSKRKVCMEVSPVYVCYFMIAVFHHIIKGFTFKHRLSVFMFHKQVYAVTHTLSFYMTLTHSSNFLPHVLR